jgi:predicted Zn-dependent peptidase
MTASQLHAVKKQLTGQICVASDNFENNALGMGKMFLHYNKFEGIERVCQRVEAITADDLLNVAGEMFDESYLSTLIYK